jgi:hypothetical protein
LEKHGGDNNPISSTNLLSSGKDSLIKMNGQLEKECWGLEPHTVYEFFVGKNRGEDKKVSLLHNLCYVVFDNC